MDNWEIAASLERMAGLLAIRGEDQYRVKAYLMASRQINRLEQPLKQLSREGRLQEIPGVGEALEKKIQELIDTGGSSYLDSLESEVPTELLAMFQITGVGLKTAHKLYAELGLRNMGDLEEAARDGRVQNVAGYLGGAILEHFEQQPGAAEAFHRGIAVPLARQWIGRLEKLPGVAACRAAGDLRRGVEMVTEALLVVGYEENSFRVFREALSEMIPGELGEIKNADGKGPSPFVTFHLGTPSGLPLHLMLVPEGQLAAALLWSTGSPAHYGQLAALARQRGLTLTAAGVLQGAGESPLRREEDREEDIYEMLGLPLIPPELREGKDEIELAGRGDLPDLVELEQIRGDLHLHSDWSDGLSSIPELAAQASARGYRYLAITDHSPSLQIARGLSPERLQEQIALIRQINQKGTYPCYLLPGMEVDIHADGSLDLPDELLFQLDLVVASVHSNFRLGKQEMTRRICRAMAHPAVHIIGHPTGRLLGSRGGYQVDLEQIIEQAAATGTALEINSSPQRLDLADVYLPRAKKQGVLLAINTDSHSRASLGDMEYGVTVARRGGLEPDDVINTRSLEEVRTLLARIRSSSNKRGE